MKPFIFQRKENQPPWGNLWENIACKLAIDPRTCGKQEQCDGCPNLNLKNVLFGQIKHVVRLDIKNYLTNC